MEIRLIARVMHLTEQYHERTHEVRLGNYSVPAVSRLFMRCDGCRIECGRIVRHGRVSRSSPGDPVLQLYVGQLGRVPLINPSTSFIIPETLDPLSIIPEISDPACRAIHGPIAPHAQAAPSFRLVSALV